MGAERWTDLFIVAWASSALAWTVVSWLAFGVEATISHRVNHWSEQYPILPLLVGILVCHWFIHRR